MSIVDGRDLGWLGWDSNHWATTVTDRGLASGLSRSLGGECYTLRQLKAEEILETVRGELNFMSGEKKPEKK